MCASVLDASVNWWDWFDRHVS